MSFNPAWATAQDYLKSKLIFVYVSVSTTQRLTVTEHLASSPKERSTYCGSQFKGTVHHAGEFWQQGLEAGVTLHPVRK